MVKCIVNNLSVDISLNHFGGVETLEFLESVDKDIKKNSLFKKSLILLKAWAYYESHILGAHSGLMSTYSLTVLLINVLLINKLNLNTPLDALKAFFEYYSSYDWSKPVEVPEIQYKKKVNDMPTLVMKYMNIIDPLRKNNNLGKSVSLTNFLRIKKAFVKGHKDLKRIIEGTESSEILTDFFKNTWRENKPDSRYFFSKIKIEKTLLSLSPKEIRDVT